MNENVEIYANSVDTILVVEHDALMRTAIAGYLRHSGYDVIEATSADEAATALSTPGIPINIVSSAVELGEGMDGFGLEQWVRANRPGRRLS